MKVNSPVEFQNFNDGVINVYSTDDSGNAINNPIKYQNIPFENRTLGYQRVFSTSQAHVDITDLIRIPKINIDKFDVIKRNGKKFEITLKQDIFDTNPQCLQLTINEIGEWPDG